MGGKKKKAVEEVKRKLEKYAVWKKYGIPTIDDRIPSFTTSILTVSSDMHVDNRNHIMTLAITEYERDVELYAKIKTMISALDELEREAVCMYYGNDFDSYEFMWSNNYKYLRKAYLHLALIDEDIDLTLQDLANEEQVSVLDIKKVAKMYIRMLVDESHVDDVIRTKRVVEKMPMVMQDILLAWAEEPELFIKNISLQRRFNFALYSFAYLADWIPLDEAKYMEIVSGFEHQEQTLRKAREIIEIKEKMEQKKI